MNETNVNYTALALEKLVPGAKWTILDGTSIEWKKNGNKYSAINFVWHDEKIDCPTKQQIDSAVEEIKLQIQSEKYKRQRIKEYPSIGEQLDALFHAGVFPEEMAEKIQAVKDKYPKP